MTFRSTSKNPLNVYLSYINQWIIKLPLNIYVLTDYTHIFFWNGFIIIFRLNSKDKTIGFSNPMSTYNNEP